MSSSAAANLRERIHEQNSCTLRTTGRASPGMSMVAWSKSVRMIFIILYEKDSEWPGATNTTRTYDSTYLRRYFFCRVFRVAAITVRGFFGVGRNSMLVISS